MSCRRHCRHSSQQGFSLVELSIVLTIIALLIGGVVIGQHLVRSSELQATVSRVAEINSNIIKFRDRYYELPGDFKTAASNWSGVSNGNGDGRIGGKAVFAINTDCGTDYWPELWNVWMHLSNAGLIKGNYSDSGSSTLTIGQQVPSGDINSSGYTVRFCGEIKTSTRYFAGQYAHLLQLGSADVATAEGTTRKGIFSTKEAAAIDTKMDDGYPHTGEILAPKKNDDQAPNCTNSNDDVPVTADYLFTNSDKRACPLFFKMGF